MKTKADMVSAICRELELVGRGIDEPITTLYLGGGTPSVLSLGELERIIATVRSNYRLNLSEFSLEANPEDLAPSYLKDLRKLGVNRLSIGVQTFNDDLLKAANRNHDSSTSIKAYHAARSEGFENINLDLIYCLPGSTEDTLRSDLRKFNMLEPEHVSIYAFTLEPRTVFENWAGKGKIQLINEDDEAAQFEMIMHELRAMGYEQYEVSNFARNGRYSEHNRGYWDLSPYLGIGPSAHSFLGGERWMNPASNVKYIRSLNEGLLPHIPESRTKYDEVNEYIFTTLRTKWGCDTDLIKKKWGRDLLGDQQAHLNAWITAGYVKRLNNVLVLNSKGLMLADRIASDLFYTSEE